MDLPTSNVPESNPTIILILDRREDAITPLLNQVRKKKKNKLILGNDSLFSSSGPIRLWFMN